METDFNKLSTSSEIKADKIFVTVFSTDSLQKPPFQGFAKSLSSKDKAGKFDILPNHENFVTWFESEINIVPVEGVPGSIKGYGVIEVANNIVRVFLKND